MKRIALVVAGSLGLAAAPAQAGEVFGGVYAHGVETPFTFETGEGGLDVQAGIRAERIEALAFIGKPAPYVMASLNSEGDTSFVAAGLSWKIKAGPVYVRPGIGLALHDAPEIRIDPDRNVRTDLGSRVLFEPEIALGVELSDKVSVEASWVHISNAQLLDSQQNPGLDMMGVRLGYRF